MKTQSCCAQPGANKTSRREFLKRISAGTSATALLSGCNFMAGPFVVDDASRDHLIPKDKQLNPKWVASLSARGAPEIHSEENLSYIGMPVGGVGCGQLYLGGDGRLWLWDIFKNNYHRETGHDNRLSAMTMGGHYVHPPTADNAVTSDNGANVDQGFACRIRDGDNSYERFLDSRGFKDDQIKFRGEYPIGRVNYSDSKLPAEFELIASSPFIPLNALDSSFPATVMHWRVRNRTDRKISVDIAGYLENATCPHADPSRGDRRVSKLVRNKDATLIMHGIIDKAPQNENYDHPADDIILANFENGKYPEGWVATGEAFQGGPVPIDAYDHWRYKIRGADGKYVALSHNFKEHGQTEVPRAEGVLTSPKFIIEKNYISFLVAGDLDPLANRVDLLVDGNVVYSCGGKNNHYLERKHVDVRRWRGKEAQVKVIDAYETDNVKFSRRRGTIIVDDIRQTDHLPKPDPVNLLHGAGTLAIGVLEGADKLSGNPYVGSAGEITASDLFDTVSDENFSDSKFDSKPVGSVASEINLEPGETRDVRFCIGWYFPDFNKKDFGALLELEQLDSLRRHYADRFESAEDVICEIAERWSEVVEPTYLWNKTWYDSTLPYWFLDRSFNSLNCAASNTCMWFSNGRFFGWEGVDCCPGTCTHVWQYAQGLARIFPELERNMRATVDYGISYNKSGLIGCRGEIVNEEATDGQCGTIIRAYREHLITGDNSFLSSIWERVKQSFLYLSYLDTDDDGLLDGKQPNTLDAEWSGPVAWISSLYLCAAAACVKMAKVMNDQEFADHCLHVLLKGRNAFTEKLFDGEYFINLPDPEDKDLINSNIGCHIDQVLGQSFAHQVGLRERVVPVFECISALNSLWNYNFTLDAGGYALAHREIEPAFRWYAMEGEAGLLMTTWPKGGAESAIPGSKKRSAENPSVWTGPGGYFNECMNGFEYQAASHMIYEGASDSELVTRGLAVFRAVHDRYHASRRNPYNEIECSNHYSRSLASYGVFLATCGFEYDGPNGHMGFAPKISPSTFRAPFTAAEGWGTYSQSLSGGSLVAHVGVKHGKVMLKSMTFNVAGVSNGTSQTKVVMSTPKENVTIAATSKRDGDSLTILFQDQVVVEAGGELKLTLGG